MDISSFILSIGISSVLGGFIYIGRKLQILDVLQEDVKDIKERVDLLERSFLKFSQRKN